eukprot:GHVO01046497.1.p1 GENE.GHVO01046497.1~~GHVO01046497.1.p1  ORF type:complete len:314 (+),score=26.83 GHVO01046497.1:758-1699(+)
MEYSYAENSVKRLDTSDAADLDKLTSSTISRSSVLSQTCFQDFDEDFVSSADETDVEATEYYDVVPEAVAGFSPGSTIVIFDWDDTILPSTWLNCNRLSLEEECSIPVHVAAMLEEMAGKAKRTLELAASLGHVVIVTNAEHGWIELSCCKFLPSLLSYIQNFRYLSARSKYESEIFKTPLNWKQLAFRDEITEHFRNSSRDGIKNIVSFGDSAHERMAIISVTRSVPVDQDGIYRFDSALTSFDPLPSFSEEVGVCRTKSVKFIERPDLEDLKREHDLIYSCFSDIIQQDSDLDLCIKSASDISADPVAFSV